MANLRAIPVPALADNYIWLLADDSGCALIVDPGEAQPVLDALAHETLRPAGILLTHHHSDHIAGVPVIRARHPGLPVIAPHDERITTATRRVRSGETVLFDAPRCEFQVIDIPGHTRTHIAFAGSGVVCAGDTLFSVGCGRLFEGTPAQMLESLGRLASLPDATLLCCGHEYTVANCEFALSVDPDNPDLRRRAEQAHAARARGEPTLPVTIGQERATNPFLRSDAPALRRAYAGTVANSAADDRVARFAWLRQAKDHFRAS